MVQCYFQNDFRLGSLEQFSLSFNPACDSGGWFEKLPASSNSLKGRYYGAQYGDGCRPKLCSPGCYDTPGIGVRQRNVSWCWGFASITANVIINGAVEVLSKHNQLKCVNGHSTLTGHCTPINWTLFQSRNCQDITCVPVRRSYLLLITSLNT